MNTPCTRPTAERRYIQFMKAIKAEPNLTRAYYNSKVLGYTAPGQHCSEWGGLHYADLIALTRTNRTVTYNLTDKGHALLKNLGL